MYPKVLNPCLIQDSSFYKKSKERKRVGWINKTELQRQSEFSKVDTNDEKSWSNSFSQSSTEKQTWAENNPKLSNTKSLSTFWKKTKKNINKNSELESKISALEVKLDETNCKIESQQEALVDEKVKSTKKCYSDYINIQSRRKYDLTTVNWPNSDKKNSINKGAFKTVAHSTNMCEDTTSIYKNSNYVDFKRAKSTETKHKSGMGNLRYNYEEDLEFQNLELNAIYEAKVDSILYKKSKNQQTRDIMKSLKATGESESNPLPNKYTIEKIFEDTIKQNASLKSENDKLRIEIKKLKLSLGRKIA